MAADGTEYDLTQIIAPYLDRHMVLRLVEFLEEQKLYPMEEILAAKLDVIGKTKMADLKLKEHRLALETAKKNNVEGAEKKFVEAEKLIKSEKSKIVSEYKKTSPLTKPLVDKFVKSGLEQPGTEPEKIAQFKKDHMIDEDSLKTLYEFSRLTFDMGFYGDSLDLLSVYRIISEDDETTYLAQWGKLAAGILLMEGDGNNAEHVAEVIEDINQLRDMISRRNHIPQLKQLMQRSWLINWSLFAYTVSTSLSADLVKFLLQERIINAIQIQCPYILRYLVAALMISYDQSKVHLKQAMDILDMERDHYRDPLTEFMRALLIEYDFENAHLQLVECEKVFSVDFFLNKKDLREAFFTNSRHLMFELYCRIHKRIDISLLAQRLHLDEKDTDKALVDLIRSAPFEGKIDSKKNQLVISTQYPSIYQKVIDKTKGLAHRTQQIADAINKRMQSKMHVMDS